MRTFITLLLLAIAPTAMAHTNWSGSFQGRATTTSDDVNEDVPFGGCYARDFVARVLGVKSWLPNQIVLFEGLIDAGLVDPVPPHQGACDASFAQFAAYGHVDIRTNSSSGDTIKAIFNPEDLLCFQKGQPEFLTLYVTGGTGRYAGATGTFDIELNDVIELEAPNTCPAYVSVNGRYTGNVVLAE